MIQIELSGEPVAKARARVFKRKSGAMGSFTPKKSQNYSDALAIAATYIMKGRKPLEGALVVVVRCFMTIPKSLSKKVECGDAHIKKPDLDNIIKQLDALNGIVWKDDSQITSLTAMKMYSNYPRILIEVGHL